MISINFPRCGYTMWFRYMIGYCVHGLWFGSCAWAFRKVTFQAIDKVPLIASVFSPYFSQVGRHAGGGVGNSRAWYRQVGSTITETLLSNYF